MSCWADTAICIGLITRFLCFWWSVLPLFCSVYCLRWHSALFSAVTILLQRDVGQAEDFSGVKFPHSRRQCVRKPTSCWWCRAQHYCFCYLRGFKSIPQWQRKATSTRTRSITNITWSMWKVRWHRKVLIGSRSSKKNFAPSTSSMLR